MTEQIIEMPASGNPPAGEISTRRFFQVRPDEEYVVLIPLTAAQSIRLAYVFSHIPSADWVNLDRKSPMTMKIVDESTIENQTDNFSQAVELYDRYIRRVEIITKKNDGIWAPSGKELPLEKIHANDKFKALTALTRVELDKADAGDATAPEISADDFLAGIGSPEFHLMAIQNDHRITGLVHVMKEASTSQEKRYRAATSRMQSSRGARKLTTSFPSDLKGICEIYDELFLSCTGYHDGENIVTRPELIPVYHKRLVMNLMFAATTVKEGEE